jgi:oxygen-independent coproporphyrinogen-3 oxidase
MSPAGRAASSRAPGPGDAFGLYVHFPFCAVRCHYCAFYFVVGRAEARSAYVDALVRSIERSARDPRFAGRMLHSVYFGGGTPSLLGPRGVERILSAARAAFPLAAGAEISLEANPDGLTLERLTGFAAAGVNRLTLGWQSLRAEHLKVLTRTHTPDENRRALEAARQAGFANVGVDLIFGVPSQTPEDWRAELAEAAAEGPEHVSAYELTLEEGTRLARRFREGRFAPAGEDARAEMFEATDEVLSPAGIERYEISNFARAGRECVHNLASWRGGDLLGVGASAASHVADTRWTAAADLDEWMRRVHAGEDPARSVEALGGATWAAEDLYLALRTADGLDADERLAVLPADARERLAQALRESERDGFVERRGGWVRLTRRGRLFVDTVFEALLRAAERG